MLLNSCSLFRNRISELVLNALDREARIEMEAHLGVCQSCRAEFRRLKSILGQVAEEGRRISPSQDLVEKLTRTARSEIDKARRERRQAFAYRVLPIAASFLILILGAMTVLIWRNPGENAQTAREASGPVWKWSYPTNGRTTGKPENAPAACGDKVFAIRSIAREECVVALDATTGKELWVFSETSCRYLTANHRRVYTIQKPRGKTASVVAIDAKKGSSVWTFKLSTKGINSYHPVLSEGILCVASDRLLWAIEADSGRLLWQLPQGENKTGCFSRPVASNGKVYFVSDGKRLCAADLYTGKSVWRAAPEPENDTGIHFSIALANNSLYLLRTDGRLVNGKARLSCHSTSSGESLWEVRAKNAPYLDATDSMVYLKGLRLWAYRSQDGSLAWSRSLGNCAPIAHVGEEVYTLKQFSTDRTEIVSLLARSGKELWSQSFPKSCSGLTLLGRDGYVETLDGVLHSFRLLTKG